MKHRVGTRLECELPDSYDDRTEIAEFRGKVVVVHPDFQPCYLVDGKLEPINPNCVQVGGGVVQCPPSQ